MKGTFSISDQELRFLKISDHLGRPIVNLRKFQTKWSEGPASVKSILKTDYRLDSRPIEAHSEFEHAPKPRPFKLRPLK